MKKLAEIAIALSVRKQRLNLIACVDEQDALGQKGNLLYRFKEDFEWFQKVTTGQVVIMGVKTYREIGRPLPNRRNIVVHNPEKGEIDTPDEVILVRSLEEALMIASFDGERDVFVIGGEALYREAYERGVDYIYRTKVWDKEPGDTFFVKEDTMKKDFHIMNNEPFKTKTCVNRISGESLTIQFEIWKANALLERADDLADWVSLHT